MAARQYKLFHFFKDALSMATSGSARYHAWMGGLTFFMLLGAYAYYIQIKYGLKVTGMNDYTSWGLYISNFTFLVGLAAAAVMVVLPAYILHDVDFSRAVLIGDGVAVAAIIMCLSFVTVDLGGPHRVWHLIPVLGYFNWPNSILAWDVLVLNGYLLLNLLIPFYILYSRYQGKEPEQKRYVPFVLLSVFWAVAIHLVTAYLYAGLPARPYWNSSLLGPRFLASAFSAGPAFIIVLIGVISSNTRYPVGEAVVHKLALIVTVAAQINLIMLGSEIFKEFYSPTEHSQSAIYLFFGLKGHNSLVPWIWTSVVLNILATFFLTINKFRKNLKYLYPICVVLFIAIWMEKGIGLVVPGFIPSPLGEVVDYFPTWVELSVTVGIWALGFFVLTPLVKVAIHIELGEMSLEKESAPSLNPSTRVSKGDRV